MLESSERYRHNTMYQATKEV